MTAALPPFGAPTILEIAFSPAVDSWRFPLR